MFAKEMPVKKPAVVYSCEEVATALGTSPEQVISLIEGGTPTAILPPLLGLRVSRLTRLRSRWLLFRHNLRNR